MKHVLVTGANGFVGRALCGRLLKSGYSVTGAFRSEESAALSAGFHDHPLFKAEVVGDMSSSTDWSKALSGVDAVVHLAARVHVMKDSISDPLSEYRKVNVEATTCLASEAAGAGIRRFVFLSTIKVNGEYTTTGPFSEKDRPSPEDPYAVSKLEAENELARISKETGMEFVIIRPPLVYGPGVKGNLLRLMKHVHRGLPLPFGGIRNARSLINLGNLVEAIILSVEKDKAANQLFLISDGEDVSTPDIIRLIAHAMSKNPKLVNIPEACFKFTAKVFPFAAPALERLTGSLKIDSKKIRNMLEWRPQKSVAEGIESMVDDYLISGRS
ncbi:MAG: SDR family oxidoreductase [Nitrospirae bacterium]|nr:MAG: SDR family oxidoreductase [Nitrospirota bacterium]